MSNLIIMPGDAPEMQPSSLVGRTLTLNFEKIRKYQTFKFYLGPARPFAVVPPDADLVDLRDALLRGDLIDVTDQHVKGVNLGEGNMSAVGISEIPGKHTIFIGSEKHEGAISDAKTLFVAIPRDDNDERNFLAELQEKGRIDGLYQPSASDIAFGPISVTDLEDDPPVQSDEGFWTLISKAFDRLFKDLRNWWSN